MSGDLSKVPRTESGKALAKSLEFLQAADQSLESKRWDAAGLAAIHCGIAAADAALIASAGVRSTAKDHSSVVAVLESRVASFRGGERRQLLGLLKMKNRVAYESRVLTEVEARQLADHARRFLCWVEKVIEG